MLFGWFGTVIRESEGGKFNKQVDLSFRWGMSWFIFSEVMFFAAFFGALFYMRVLSVPWLASGDTGELLWPGFKGDWPVSGPGHRGAVHADGRLGHPGDQHADPADLRRDRDLGALGAEEGQPRAARSRACS